MPRDRDSTLNMFRLFVEDYDMDVDLNKPPTEPFAASRNSRLQWAINIPNDACIELVVRNQTLPWVSRPFQHRLEWAMLQGREWEEDYEIDPDMLIRWVGLSWSDVRRSNFDSLRGKGLLYCAAIEMRKYIFEADIFESDTGHAFRWGQFAAELIARGASPNIVGPNGESLLRLLLVPEYGDQEETLARWVQVTRWWSTLLRKAGYILHNYGAEETELEFLCHRASSETDRPFTLVQPLFAEKPEDWSVLIRRTASIPIYKLHTTPGAWHSTTNPIRTITWEPALKEHMEGRWVKVGSKVVTSMPLDAAQAIWSPTQDGFNALIDAAQDDHGPIALMLGVRKRRPSVGRRSCSQPPELRRRDVAYYKPQQQLRSRRWLPGYHLCPLTMRHRFGCPGSYAPPYVTLRDRNLICSMSVRDCLVGKRHANQMLHETYEWQTSSFVAERDRRRGVDRESNRPGIPYIVDKYMV